MDIVCYAVGCVAAFLLDQIIIKKTNVKIDPEGERKMRENEEAHW